jgi:DNA invertase Pin-like site-specific DNA recombinase
MDRQPIAWGYSRVSHAEGFKKGDSCESQTVRIQAYFDTHLKSLDFVLGTIDNDGENISAYKTKFQNRPAGRRLLAKMQAGDCLIVDKIDRLWRSIEDFVMLMKVLESRKISIHIVNFLGQTIQSDSPMGSYMLKHFVLVSELESAMKAERTKEAIGVIRLKGRVFNHNIPPGCKAVPIVDRHGRAERNPKNGRKLRMLVWCPETRELMKYICHLVDEKRLRWVAAFGMIEEYVAKRDGREIRSVAAQSTDRTIWKKFHTYENAYEYLGIKEPGQIPKRAIIFAAAKQNRRERTDSRAGARGFKKSRIKKIEPHQLLDLATGR